MARPVIWTEAARTDLDEVAEYVARADPGEAGRIVAEALRRADDRAMFPESGSIVPEANEPQMREVIVKRSFRLIYELSPGQITIIAFIRARRKLTKKSLAARHPSK